MKRKINILDFEARHCVTRRISSQTTEISFEDEKSSFMLRGKPGRAGDINWSRSQYIYFDIKNLCDHSLAVIFNFWETGSPEQKPDMSIKMGVMPDLKTRVSCPLEALKAENLFLDRTPGKLKTVVQGDKVEIKKIDRFSLTVSDFLEEQSIIISDIYFSEMEPEYPLPEKTIVDELGQWEEKEWPGKTDSEEKLKSYLKQQTEVKKTDKQDSADQKQDTEQKQDTDQKQDLSPPEQTTKYGSLINKEFTGTGFFRTEFAEDRWFLVDPEGYAFFSIGLDCINPGAGARVDGLRSLFAWLPGKEGKFAAAWSKRQNSSEFFDFHKANLIRAFGEKWWQRWAEMTEKRLLNWGFNTIGNWSSVEFCRQSNIPYVLPLQDFPTTEKKIFRDFPDVFSPEYKKEADNYAAQLEDFKDDSQLIGYFLRNEPNWAFVRDLNIAEKLLASEKDLVSKEKMIEFLKERYGALEQFNEKWCLNLSFWGQLKKGITEAGELSAAAFQDLQDFSRKMIAEYTAVPSAACRKVDPNHLNLGMRYAYIWSDILYAGCENFDVFSFNCYKFDPTEEIKKIGKKTDLPVMIGEFHFGALDRGLPSTGLKGAASQEERGRAYRYYIENCATTKYAVGAHYFTLNDQPVLGRFDGENYQIGLVDVCHKPYREFVNEVQKTNKTLYEVVTGKRVPTEQKAESVPPVAF